MSVDTRRKIVMYKKNMTPKAISMKEIIDKLVFMKMGFFCSVKDSLKRMRR